MRFLTGLIFRIPAIIKLNQTDPRFRGGLFIERGNMAIEHGSGNVEPVSQFLHVFVRGEKYLQNLFFTICQSKVVAELPEVELAV